MNGSILAGGGSGGGLTDWLRVAIAARRDREKQDMNKVNQMMAGRKLRAKMDEIQNRRNQLERLQKAQDFKEESYETDLLWSLLEPAKKELMSERGQNLRELQRKLKEAKKDTSILPFTPYEDPALVKRLSEEEAVAREENLRGIPSEKVFQKARVLKEKLRAAARQRGSGVEQERTQGVLPPGTKRLKILDEMTAAEYLRRAGGDPEVARRMARNDGWKF